MSQHLPSSSRIRDSKDFSSTFKASKRRGFSYGTVFIRLNDSAVPRLGISVAKRFFKKAHDRNRWKRLVRESFRTHKGLLSSIDVVVVVRKEAEQCSNQAFLASLNGVWNYLAS